MALYTLFVARHLFSVGTFICFGLCVIGLTFPIVMHPNGVTCYTFFGLKATCGQGEPTVKLYDDPVLCDSAKQRIVIAAACQILCCCLTFMNQLGTNFIIKRKWKFLQIPCVLSSLAVSTALLLNWVLVASVCELEVCFPNESLRSKGWYLGSSFCMTVASIFANTTGLMILVIALIVTKNGSAEPDPVFTESEPDEDEMKEVASD